MIETIQVKEIDGVYSCDIGIRKEEWLNLLKNTNMPDEYRDALLRFYYMPEHRGSCFEHPRNKESRGHKSLFTDGSGWCYPDFLSPETVLDAKYKWYDDWSKIQTKDLYQVISYMHVLDRKMGGYIVPVDWTSSRLPSKTLKGKGGVMSVYGMDVTFTTNSFVAYSNYMDQKQEELKKDIISAYLHQ